MKKRLLLQTALDYKPHSKRKPCNKSLLMATIMISFWGHN